MASPEPMIQVGNKGDIGTAELQDLLFTATGATAGVILLEWNLAESSQGAAAMWDVRLLTSRPLFISEVYHCTHVHQDAPRSAELVFLC